MICEWCQEELTPVEPYCKMHQECAFRCISGSVGHILRRCGCFKPGGENLGDPPKLTKREAALAALTLFRQIGDWYGDAA